MQICPNTHQLDVPFAGRVVSVYLLLGDRPILIDSGVADSPANHILPYLLGVGLDPKDLWGVVNTHAHTDHCGGNHQLMQANSELHILAHERECADVGDPVGGVHALFDPYRDIIGAADADAGIRWNVEHLGPGTPVNSPLKDGMQLWLATDWPVQVHHAPGHTMGHLALHDLGHHSAFIGDAVGWRGTFMDGRSLQFPVYVDPAAYLATIRQIQSWPLERLCTSHYSTLRGKEIDNFLDDSQSFVFDLDRAIMRVLDGTRAPQVSREISEAVLDIMGDDYIFDICAVITIDAHVKRLREQGEYRQA